MARVTTAEEMRDAVLGAASDADAVVMAAAVADFRPEAPAGGKIKKEHGPPVVQLDAGHPLRARLVEGRPRARRVRRRDRGRRGGRQEEAQGKGVDLLVANEVGHEGTGFGSDTNRAAILAADGQDEPLREWTKRELAAAICDWRSCSPAEGPAGASGATAMLAPR